MITTCHVRHRREQRQTSGFRSFTFSMASSTWPHCTAFRTAIRSVIVPKSMSAVYCSGNRVSYYFSLISWPIMMSRSCHIQCERIWGPTKNTRLSVHSSLANKCRNIKWKDTLSSWLHLKLFSSLYIALSNQEVHHQFVHVFFHNLDLTQFLFPFFLCNDLLWWRLATHTETLVPACSTSIHIAVLPSLKTWKHDQTVKRFAVLSICYPCPWFNMWSQVCLSFGNHIS